MSGGWPPGDAGLVTGGFPLRGYGECGWLVGAAGARRAVLLAALEARPPRGLVEWVAGFDNVLLWFGAPVAREVVASWLGRLGEHGGFGPQPVAGTGAALAGLAPAPVHHRIPVRYDGADLAEVASALGLGIDELIALHSGTQYEVQVMGFSPGFAYLGPLDARLHLPRRSVPRPRVPAGSVAIGGTHAGIYPSSSPGGWHLLGTTDFRLFDPVAARGGAPRARDVFTLAPGDRVTFVPIT